MPREDITNKALDYCCSMCDGELVKIWDHENNTERWCCSRDDTHNGFKRKVSPAQALKRGEADKVMGKGAQTDLEKRAKETSAMLSNLPKSDAGDFTPVNVLKLHMLIKWAESVGLNAYLGHVELYYGEPRVSIDGYYYLNNKKEKPYRIGTIPMDQETRKLYGLAEGDHGYLARGYYDGQFLPEVGIGIVKGSELTEMSAKKPDQKRYPVVAEYPQRMAEKRAEWQLLRKLIPLEVKDDAQTD